jgi:virginiamycin B lyase
MKGTNRTITRLTHTLAGATALVACAVLIVPATGGAVQKPAPIIKSASTSTFPEEVHGIAVAIAPDGVPWFGLRVQRGGPSLAHSESGTLEVDALAKEGEYAETTALQFDSEGALWFAENVEGSQALARRTPDGTVTEFPIPKGEPITALTFGPEGDVWFARSGYGENEEAQVGRMTLTGAVTQFPLETGAGPTSITTGPDGALWFNEERKGKIGRITPSGDVQLFELGTTVEPRQIVVGSEGALWFSENGQKRRYGRASDRVGRITASGEVTQFPVPFGTGTSKLAADPRGVVWFATDKGELSSISPSGNVGARGCVGECGEPIEGLALAPDGSLWFAAAHKYCERCGGGSDLIAEHFGTKVGEVHSGALAPADPNGPPAVDPYAIQTDNPPPPIARTGKPRELEPGYIELTGYINSRGYPTNWQFRWGKTKNYEHRSFRSEDPFRAEEGAATIGEEVFGLCPETTYHYEIVAFGPGGRVPGGDETFRTPRQKRIPKHCLAH